MSKAEYFKRIEDLFTVNVPHCYALGFHSPRVEEGKVELSVDYKDFMLGNIQRGFIHGSVIFSLIDSAAGMAACSAIEEAERVVTLDMRVDNLSPAVKGKSITAEAVCYRLTANIAFIKAIAYQQSKDAPVAVSQSTFMRLKPDSVTVPAY